MYTTVPWQSDGGWVHNTGESFVFRLESTETLLKVMMREETSQGIGHHSNHLAYFDGFEVCDKANCEYNTASINHYYYEFPKDIGIKRETYFGGARCFKLDETLVYRVID